MTKDNKKQGCPLCSISDESLDRLRKQGEEKKAQKDKIIKEKRGLLKKLFG